MIAGYKIQNPIINNQYPEFNIQNPESEMLPHP